MKRRRTRRDVLRLSGVGLAGVIAGCTSGTGGDGGGDGTTDDGSGSPTPTETTTGDAGDDSDGEAVGGVLPEYAAWLPAPENIHTPDRQPGDGYRFRHVDVSTILQNGQQFSDEAYDFIKRRFRAIPYFSKAADVSGILLFGSAGNIGVAEGSVATSAAKKRLSEGDDSPTEYDGYDIYRPGDRAVAVSGEAVLIDSNLSEGDGLEDLKAMVDARSGSTDRYHQADADVGAVLGAFDGGFYSEADRPEEYGAAIGKGLQAIGREFSLEGTRSTLDVVLAYDAADSVDAEGLREWANSYAAFGGSQEIDVTTSGARTVVSGSVATDRLSVTPSYRIEVGDAMVAVPQVAIDWTWDETTGEVTAVHNGGDSLQGSNLSVVCGDARIQISEGTYRSGNRILRTAKCSTGEEVRIVWTNPEGGRTQVISTYTIPT